MSVRRVALVSDYSLDVLGGAQTALVEQARALAVGHEVVLVAPASRRLARVGRDLGIEVIGLPAALYVPFAQVVSVRNTPRTREVVHRALAGADVVHLHSELGLATAALQVARARGIPVVETIHCWFHTSYPIQWLLPLVVPVYQRLVAGTRWRRRPLADLPGDAALRGLTYAVAEQADRIVVPSQHVADQVTAAGLGPVDVIPNALAVPPEAEVLDEHTAAGPLRVVWIGRAVEEKRLTLFVRAVVAAAERLGPGRLQVEVIGSGESLVRARAIARGRPEVTCRGRLPHAEVQERIRAAHVMVLTSCGFDNQPMTVVESVMALRGVVHRDPALTEGLDGGAGIPAFGGVDELAATLVRLADDRAEVVSASRACLAARRTFLGEAYVERVLSCYTRAGAG
ncbi:glycosyltransferase [Mariniluteicoccus endophyticus]